MGTGPVISEHATRLSPARKLAVSILLDVERREAFARDVLNASVALRALDARDAGFTRRLVLGVTATRGCLDDFLACCSDRNTKFNRRVRCALRVAAFELLYLDAPACVVVSQGVELVRSQSWGAAALANAVLHRATSYAEQFLDADGADPAHASIVSTARRSGIPVWLARKIDADLEEPSARDVFSSHLDAAPVTFHLNPLHGDPSENIRFNSIPHDLPGCIEPSDTAAYIASGSLAAFDSVASDESAQLIATSATRPGSCLEIGAGRGTKTFIMACQSLRTGWSRDHVAVDLYQEKCRLNASRLIDAGLPPACFAYGDARDLDAVLVDIDRESGSKKLFDTVFLDAPCSGTGTMRRHPEIPWRLSKNDVDNDLPNLQFELLCSAASRVSPGGELYYATCSILSAENNEVVQRFLASSAGKGFCLAPVSESMIYSNPLFLDAAAAVRRGENQMGCFSSHPARDLPDGHFCARFIMK